MVYWTGRGSEFFLHLVVLYVPINVSKRKLPRCKGCYVNSKAIKFHAVLIQYTYTYSSCDINKYDAN